MYPPVLTKHDCVRRYKAGEFGNASITWNTAGQLLRSEYVGKVHLRNRIAGGPTYYNMAPDEALERWFAASHQENWYCSAMAPHDKNLIQGEVKQAEAGSGRVGLDLLYTCVMNLPMRDALAAQTLTDNGVAAALLLRRFLCPNSHEWLMELIRRYPGHVVEFSTFSTKWGTLYPRFNTVIWEVRLY